MIRLRAIMIMDAATERYSLDAVDVASLLQLALLKE